MGHQRYQRRSSSENNIQMANVDANAYSGQRNTNLTADHGTINKVNGNVHLQDNVVITSNDRGTQMTTDTLDWNRNEDQPFQHSMTRSRSSDRLKGCCHRPGPDSPPEFEKGADQ